jgi:fluoroacetyl-CoA thioesterase
MKLIFKPGDKKVYHKRVTEQDVAAFHGEVLHPVYSTFALARDFEWTSRLFFLEMKEPHEEGVGTFLNINHQSPAKVEEDIIITASVESIKGNELICILLATCEGRTIATGRTGQKMLTKDKLKELFENK